MQRRPSGHKVHDDVADNGQPIAGESSAEPLIKRPVAHEVADSPESPIVNAAEIDVMHNLELTHDFRKARIAADKARLATPLSRRLCTLKKGKSIGAVAVIPFGHELFPESVNQDLFESSTGNNDTAARATTSDLNSTRSSPAPAGHHHTISKSKHDISSAKESSGVEHATQHKISHNMGHAIGHNLALNAFLRAVHEETRPVPHEGLQKLNFDNDSVPMCECGEACALMYNVEKDDHTPVDENEVFDPNEEGMVFLWICSAGACMFYSIEGGDQPDVFVEDATFTPLDMDDLVSESDDLVRDTALKLLEQPPAHFWEGINKYITRLDSDIGNLSIHRAHCDCDLNCSIAICNVSGDLFWVCPVEKCIFVAHLERRPDNIDNWNGYVGVITPIGHAEIDRYTNMAYLQKNFASCFTLDYLNKLSKSGADADFPSGSFAMEKDMKYHAFLSYRGATGRLALYLSLIGEFNFLYAFIFVFLIGPVIVAGLSFIPDPCTHGWPIWMMGVDGCLHNMDDGTRYKGYSWLFWQTWATPIVLIIIWCGPIIWSWRSYYHIFLDNLERWTRKFYEIF